jgi:hypothetical protein
MKSLQNDPNSTKKDVVKHIMQDFELLKQYSVLSSRNLG